jgi:general secretion pathway protein D
MMNADYRLKTIASLFASTFLAVTLAGCTASHSAIRRATKAEQARDFDTAMQEYKIALDQNPANIDYQLKYEQARFAAAFTHFQAGRRALQANDLDTAKKEFQRTVEIDPTNDLAVQELQRISDIEQRRAQQQAIPELSYEDMREATRTNPTAQSQMEPKIQEPISVKMTQDSKIVYDTLAQIVGFNVIFDKDFRGTTIPVDLNNVDIFSALDIVAMQTETFWQPVNKNTILVAQDNQTKRREYEQQVLKTIYLSNSVTATEITEAITAIRTLLNVRYITQYSTMNAILIRDTPDKVAIAERILQDVDKSKPEVIVDAMILEVDRNTLRNFGISPPTTVLFGNTNDTSTGAANSVVNVRDLDGINSGSFSVVIPQPVAQALATSSNAKLLQNPSVRATDGKLAAIHIGQKIPVPQGSFQPAFVGATGTPVVQYQYADVGVNLDITPRVLLNRDVSMQVQVVVSALAGNRDVGGVILPVFSNRSIQHEIRLSEGETNVLGGIISDSESTSITGLPILKDIPVLKFLFGMENKQRDKSEIIVLLTPHIVRMPNITEDNLRGTYIGTEANTRLRNAPVMIGSQNPPTAPSVPGSGAAAAPAGPLPPGVTVGTTTPPPPTPPPAPRTTTSAVSFSPATITLPAGQATPVNITITGDNVFAADLTLSFDPSSVKIQDIRDGGFLSRDGQIIALVQNIDSEAGTARISLERPPGAPPLSGTGSLVTLILEPGTRKGDSALRITDFRVRDPQHNPYVGKSAEARVTVP